MSALDGFGSAAANFAPKYGVWFFLDDTTGTPIAKIADHFEVLLSCNFVIDGEMHRAVHPFTFAKAEDAEEFVKTIRLPVGLSRAMAA